MQQKKKDSEEEKVESMKVGRRKKIRRRSLGTGGEWVGRTATRERARKLSSPSGIVFILRVPVGF